MQKKYRFFLFFSLLTGLAISQPVAAQNRLKKITYSDGSVRQFFYDSKGKLAKEELTREQSPLSQIQHDYSTNGKLASYSMRYQNPEAPWNYGYSENYKYSPEGRLSSKERYLLRKGMSPDKPDKSLFFSDSLIYNAAGQIVGRQRYTYAPRGDLSGQSPITMTTNQYRYDERGNLVEETVTTNPLQRNAASTTQTRRIVYEYDAKPNPYCLADCPIFDQMSWSKNNCIRASTYQMGVGSQTKPSVSEYRYVYDNDLPVRRIQAQNSTVLEQYEYETN
ncbi:hypothetical protein GCM10028803_36450 [Larkinella knui]|uniref:RHS repeat protein n=1 Tax=Larkinella knui TaxID=2025310 RepID=A0A3P1CF41_9BACT|nr:hypothetical protein [Larkinella knui]RRB11504.1 hypothetical protein EHT87_23805 [Larkinella knui]